MVRALFLNFVAYVFEYDLLVLCPLPVANQ